MSIEFALATWQSSKVWQHSSLLEGDLACLQQLQQKNSQWKFYLNIVRMLSMKTISLLHLTVETDHILAHSQKFVQSHAFFPGGLRVPPHHKLGAGSTAERGREGFAGIR